MGLELASESSFEAIAVDRKYLLDIDKDETEGRDGADDRERDDPFSLSMHLYSSGLALHKIAEKNQDQLRLQNLYDFEVV